MRHRPYGMFLWLKCWVWYVAFSFHLETGSVVCHCCSPYLSDLRSQSAGPPAVASRIVPCFSQLVTLGSAVSWTRLLQLNCLAYCSLRNFPPSWRWQIDIYGLVQCVSGRLQAIWPSDFLWGFNNFFNILMLIYNMKELIFQATSGFDCLKKSALSLN